MNAYLRASTPVAVLESWAGGPCIATGQYCPVWSVRRADGTGTQQRGPSSGPDVRTLREVERVAVQQRAAETGMRAAVAWVGAS